MGPHAHQDVVSHYWKQHGRAAWRSPMLRITGISLVVALIVAGSGCGGGYSAPQSPGSKPSPSPTPSPGPTGSFGGVTITAISPTSVAAGSPGFTLRVAGSKFDL